MSQDSLMRSQALVELKPSAARLASTAWAPEVRNE